MSNRITEIELKIYAVGDHEPADGSIVVAWSDLSNLPAVQEYRKRKACFYTGQMPTNPNWFFYLSDLVGLDVVQEIRRRWDTRDDKKPRTLTR